MLTLRNARSDNGVLKIRLKYYLWRDAKQCGGDGGGVVSTNDAK